MLFNHKVTEISPPFTCITIFTTALCNLNCSYCYICKDSEGGLKKIDDEIEEAFRTNAYIKQVLDLDPACKDSITQISLWGGEPFLKIYRFIDHIPDFFNSFPNIDFFDVSTNLNLSDHPQRIQDLINAVEKNFSLLNISKNLSKRFKVNIQISIDGYKEMNDVTRGKGVTQKIFDNWKIILDTLDFNENLIEVNFFTKSTFSKESWHFVDTPEKAYKWCASLHYNLYQPWKESSCKAQYSHGMWNNAMPTEYCQQDGIKYTEVVKAFQEAFDQVTADLDSWRGYPTIVSEAIQPIDYIKIELNNDGKQLHKNLSCKKCGMACGVFAYNLVPIPNNKFTMCHRGLFDAYADYANNSSQIEHLHGLAELWTSIDAKKFWVFDKEQIMQMHKTMQKIYDYPNQIFYTDLVQQIMYYAKSGIIDSKYTNMNEIKPTLVTFLCNSQCIQDCFIFGGSWTTRTPLEIPLYYNGAMDIIVEEINKYNEIEEKRKYEKIQPISTRIE